MGHKYPTVSRTLLWRVWYVNHGPSGQDPNLEWVEEVPVCVRVMIAEMEHHH